MLRKRILFIGGEQNGMVNLVADKLNEVRRDVYPRIDLKTVFGIVTISPPLRTEIYRRRVIDGRECFILEETTGHNQPSS